MTRRGSWENLLWWEKGGRRVGKPREKGVLFMVTILYRIVTPKRHSALAWVGLVGG